jgi:hypothetical protein
MKNVLRFSVVTVAFIWTHASFGQPSLPEWLIGQWQPSRSHYGSDPTDYCLLTVAAGQLSWRERPGGEARTFSYEVVVEEADFVVARTEHPYGFSHRCLRVPSPGYFRFDRKNYFNCTFEARRKNESAGAVCPKPFDPNDFAFELSVWRTLEGALQIADDPAYWSRYFRVPAYR